MRSQFDLERERDIKPLPINSGDLDGKEVHEEETRPQGIHGDRHQTVESAFESQNSGFEIV